MRYYRFVVGGQLFELSSSNPNEVRIVFDITSTDDVEYSRPTIISLYNVSSSFFTLAKQFKNTPMILCLYEDGCEIDKGDIVIISDKKYSVVYKANIQNFDIAFDISLEEFIYGK